MLFFGKYAATQATAVHAAGRGFASVQFPDVSDVARLLVGGAHAFNSQDKTLLAILEPNCSNTHDGTTTAPKTLPAMPAPALLPGEAGVIQVCWSALNLAAAYRVELRAAGAGGWSAVDSYGRVQPEGAAPLLSAQTTCLAVNGLSPDVLYEARVAYTSSCGCQSDASDPSAPCRVFQMLPTHSPHSPHSMLVPPPPPNTPLACPQVQLQPCSPCTPVSMMPPSPCAPAHMQHMQPFNQYIHAPQQPHTAGYCCPHSMPVLQPPAAPELRLADQTGTALAALWQGVDPAAASYIVQLRELNSVATERFVRPANGTFGVLDLCIGGLVPNGCYTACISSVSHCGCESPPSCWSPWLTLNTGATVPVPMPPVCITQAPSMPVSQSQHQHQMMPPQQLPVIGESHPLQAEDPKKFQAAMIAMPPSPPEVTGHEEEMLLLD